MLTTDARALGLPDSVSRVIGDSPIFVNDIGRSSATVVYIEKYGGLYMKIDEAGSLARASDMQNFLHKNGLSTELLLYESLDRDYIISKSAAGECAISEKYLFDPKRLTVMLAEAARGLHVLSVEGCPNANKTDVFLAEFDRLCQKKAQPRRDIMRFLRLESEDEIIKTVNEHRRRLKNDTVIHGDMCLPNFMFDGNKFSAFIDLSDGGLGDRHYDIFWVLWSMWYNFKTDKYTELFLDSYGRDNVDASLVRACGCMCAF